VNSELMFSKASDNWSTPQGFFDGLNAEFGFDLDAAASAENAKVMPYLCADLDALIAHWHDCGSRVWCNPPYSRCAEFVAKAAHEQRHGVTTVMLIPSRTDTRWWHEFIWDREQHRCRPGVEVRFVKGRLKFGEGKNSAPFPSVVVIFRPLSEGR
jgi:site-specific DNA-methyltransferase (adenine-specific)